MRRPYLFSLLISFLSFVSAEDFKVEAPILYPLSTKKVLEKTGLHENLSLNENIPLTNLWIEKLGISMHHIESNGTIYPRGPSYRTTSNVPMNETLISIPLTSIISMDDVYRSPISSFLLDYPEISDTYGLALYLMYEKQKKETSVWYDYLSSMPEFPSNLFFLPSELDQLIVGSHIARLLSSRMYLLKTFLNDYEEILTSDQDHEPYFTLEEFTLENLAWAIGTVLSRAIMLEQMVDNQTLARPFLIPIMDTLAHCTNQCISKFYVHENSMHYVAEKDLQAHEIITLSPPELDSFSYLLSYGGYKPPTMFQESLPVQLNVEKNDPLLEKKSQLLEEMHMPMNSTYHLRYGAHDGIHNTTLMSMRIKVLTREEMELIDQIPHGGIISPRNEYAVCRSLYHTFSALCNAYKSSIEEDKAAIVNPETSENEKAIRKTLLFEKEILEEAMNDIKSYWMNLLMEERL